MPLDPKKVREFQKGFKGEGQPGFLERIRDLLGIGQEEGVSNQLPGEERMPIPTPSPTPTPESRISQPRVQSGVEKVRQAGEQDAVARLDIPDEENKKRASVRNLLARLRKSMPG